MLSSDEYARIHKQLKNIPSSLTSKQQHDLRQTLRKKLKEHYYASHYPPFEPLPYELIFVNRTTTERTLLKLIQAVNDSTLFTLDTESVGILHQPNQPALIQLQIILSAPFSLIIIVEVCHLPRPHQSQFSLIKKLFDLLFQPDKNIYIWGEIDELIGFAQSQLFTINQIYLSNNVNVQHRFRQYWSNNHPHRPLPLSANTSPCQCELCLGINPGELWSLQTATAVQLNRWIDKRFTRKPFNIGLDPQLSHLNEQQLTFRRQMWTYAAYDCDVIYQLIMSAQLLDAHHLSPQRTHEPDSLASADTLAPLDRSANSSSNNLLNDRPTTITNYSIAHYSQAPLEPVIHEPISANDEQQPTPDYPQQLSEEERKRIHNRSCTLRQRKRQYKHEIIYRHFDRRFSISKVKQLLRANSIEFSALNTSKPSSNHDTLYIGIKYPDKATEYEQTIKNLFSTENYHRLYHYQSRSNNHHRYQHRSRSNNHHRYQHRSRSNNHHRYQHQ
jgi:hypothetical protein